MLKLTTVQHAGLLRPKAFFKLSTEVDGVEVCKYVLGCKLFLRIRLVIASRQLKAVARKLTKFKANHGL